MLSQIYIGVQVKCPLFLTDFNQTCIFSTDFFEQYSNTKFREAPSRGSQVVPCGQTDTHDATNSRFSKFCEGALKLKGEFKNSHFN
jgi:hypothetical protein